MAVSSVKTRLAIFDLDGTLGVLPVDWYGLKSAMEKFILAKTGASVPFKFWGGRKYLMENLGPAYLKEAFNLIEEYEREGAIAFHPNELAINFLKASASTGSMIAICSNNMTSTIRLVLERLTISGLVSYIVGMDSVLNVKPDPEGLLLILKELNVSRNEAVFIGDASTDFDAARAASIRFVAVDGPEFEQLR